MNNITLVSTRFNETTWAENRSYRIKHTDIACIYGSPKPLPDKILLNSLLLVVEMNNTTNQVEGIGLIRNFSKLNRPIYQIGNFNRYTYQGKYHINREQILKENPQLVEGFEHILFKGKTHMKRGSGFTTIPEKLLKDRIWEERDVKTELKELFRKSKLEDLKEEEINI
jgi:hypothetical protein